jgi:hypothetical protein
MESRLRKSFRVASYPMRLLSHLWITITFYAAQ